MRDDRKRLKDIVELVSEKAVTQKRSDWPYLGLEHLAAGEPRLLGQARSDTSVSVNSVFQAGDILFGKLRPNLRKTLQVGFPGYCSTDILVFRAQADHNAEYVARLFQHESIAVAAVASAEGTKMPRTSWSRLSGELAFVPPLPEQRRIAQILDMLDSTIESTQRIIEKLQATRQGLLHDLLTRGLDEHGKLRDPERNPELFKETELGRLPREWEVRVLSEVLAAVIDCPHTTPIFTTTGVPIARTSSIKNGLFNVIGASRTSHADYLNRIARGRPEAGDIIFTREAPVGEAFVIPKELEVSLGQRTVLLKPSKLLSSEYLLQYIYSSFFNLHIKNVTGGTTNPHLNVSEIRRIPLPLPGIQEQNRIVDLLQTHQARTATEQIRLAKLQALKRGLMDDLLTGRVRVPLSEAER